VLEKFKSSSPKLFLTTEERKALAARINEFERSSDCELVLHLRRKLPVSDALESARGLFYKFGLEKTERRTGILLLLALQDRKFAIWADEGVVRRSSDQLFKQVCDKISEGLKGGKHLEALLSGIDVLEKTLGHEQPALVRNPDELSNEPIIED
jgi:uncharacterized membrane protein